jgi:hypothetical protein
MPSSPVKLGVYRRLDDRFAGLSDDSPRALELHKRRRAALHDVLDNEKSIEVLDWGYTDDSQPHEFVEITLGALASAAFTYVLAPGLKYVAEKLAEKTSDQAASEVARWLIAKLRLKQELKEILDFQIRLPDGTTIQVDPPDRYARISIAFTDGTVSSITYTSQGTN